MTLRTASAQVWAGPVTPRERTPSVVLSACPEKSVDTVRALCHDLRQPLAAIRILAGVKGGDARPRLDVILEEVEWLSDMVEGVIGDAVDDSLGNVEVVGLAAHCVSRAQPTAPCSVELIGIDRVMAVASPVALSRAVGCLLDNAVRAAGPGGHVTVTVDETDTETDSEVTIRVADDGPGFGHVPTNNSLGLTITRALVSACGGSFDLKPGSAGGAVARIGLPAMPGVRRRVHSSRPVRGKESGEVSG